MRGLQFLAANCCALTEGCVGVPVVGEDLVFFEVFQRVLIACRRRLPGAARIVRTLDDAVVERNPNRDRHAAQALGSAAAQEQRKGAITAMVATASTDNARCCARNGTLEGFDKRLGSFSRELAGHGYDFGVSTTNGRNMATRMTSGPSVFGSNPLAVQVRMNSSADMLR